ncbi:hypothetical protein BLNAU_8531 [Blattamonas nauphoetae]|uniref:RRM domain-containing protein n=1 Tax=Blattamonas nauphoetae TaxID=2049346 RepID=A0ABQ9XYA7_9EUKA|nr:hypothetical protein BLNAU_8531 [Blattamonas nauphoetae]
MLPTVTQEPIIASVRRPEKHQCLYGLFFPFFPPFIQKQEMIDLYSKYGEILELSIIHPDPDSRQDGYAFLRFEHLISALQALADPTPPLFMHPFTRRPFSLEAHFGDQKATLFLNNLPRAYSNSAMKDILDQFTSIRSLTFTYAKDPAHRKEGQAWISYNTHEEAYNSHRKLSGQILNGHSIIAYFARRRVVDPRPSMESPYVKLSRFDPGTTIDAIHNVFATVIDPSVMNCLEEIVVQHEEKVNAEGKIVKRKDEDEDQGPITILSVLLYFQCEFCVDTAIQTLNQTLLNGSPLQATKEHGRTTDRLEKRKILPPIPICTHQALIPSESVFQSTGLVPPSSNYSPNDLQSMSVEDRKEVNIYLPSDKLHHSPHPACPWTRLALDDPASVPSGPSFVVIFKDKKKDQPPTQPPLAQSDFLDSLPSALPRRLQVSSTVAHKEPSAALRALLPPEMLKPPPQRPYGPSTIDPPTGLAKPPLLSQPVLQYGEKEKKKSILRRLRKERDKQILKEEAMGELGDGGKRRHRIHVHSGSKTIEAEEYIVEGEGKPKRRIHISSRRTMTPEEYEKRKREHEERKEARRLAKLEKERLLMEKERLFVEQMNLHQTEQQQQPTTSFEGAI